MDLGYCLVSPASSRYQAFLFLHEPFTEVHVPGNPDGPVFPVLLTENENMGVENMEDINKTEIDLIDCYRLAVDFGKPAADKALALIDEGRSRTSELSAAEIRTVADNLLKNWEMIS